MVQESTMICVDNSEWTRNGDYAPTRLQAETDAANLIVQVKLRANPENAVGVLTMAEEVRVLSTMTQENSKLFMKLHGIEPKGQCQFLTAIKVAHLALKHRQNRNHRMRIVLFVGSPMGGVDQAELLKLSKKLKKEKVQMDVVCFGDPDTDNAAILNPIIDVLNGKEGSGSNMVVVGPGSKLTEALASSPIIRGEDGAAGPVVGAGGGFDGFDADDDPDLALALRVSLEEQRAAAAAADPEVYQQIINELPSTDDEFGSLLHTINPDDVLKKALAFHKAIGDIREANGKSTMTGPGPSADLTQFPKFMRGEYGESRPNEAWAEAPAAAAAAADMMNVDIGAMTEEQQLEWALRMSMQDSAPAAAAAPMEQDEGGAAPAAAAAADMMNVDIGAMTEEQQLEWALRMSMQDSAPAAAAAAPMKQDEGGAAPAAAAADDLDELMNDPEVFQQIINELPGTEKKDDDKA